jgi:cytochrome c oxidase subunit 2
VNTVPGLTTRLKVTPSITTNEMKEKRNDPNFNYVLMCNKICGGAHYKMKMIVVVDSPSTYKKWMKTKKTFKDEFLAAPAPAAAETPADSLVVAVN